MKKPVHHNQGAAIGGKFEAELQYTVLSKCKHCGAKHPLAHKPQLPADVCPGCGEPTEIGVTKVEGAHLGGSPVLNIGKGLLALGNALSNLSKRI